ncbi:MAG: hypothetical protein K6E27_01005 [Eubacterium sp.]|nr:hypothetical protein [Eubacterium sp.]
MGVPGNIRRHRDIISVYKCGSDALLLPIGVEPNSDSLMTWLKTRLIPKNREYSDSFLSKIGLSHNDTKGILKVCKGLSLNDSYWVVENDDEKFEEYNLYEHSFLKALSLIAYTGYRSN